MPMSESAFDRRRTSSWRKVRAGDQSKVTWPTRKETTDDHRDRGMVFIMVDHGGIFLMLVDQVLGSVACR